MWAILIYAGTLDYRTHTQLEIQILNPKHKGNSFTSGLQLDIEKKKNEKNTKYCIITQTSLAMADHYPHVGLSYD